MGSPSLFILGLRFDDKLCRFSGALAQLFERAAERLAASLRLQSLANGQGEPVNGFSEPLGEVDEDHQGIGVQFPDR